MLHAHTAFAPSTIEVYTLDQGKYIHKQQLQSCSIRTEACITLLQIMLHAIGHQIATERTSRGFILEYLQLEHMTELIMVKSLYFSWLAR